MHLQLGGSPKDTAGNMRAILTALADINIAAIAPSFDPPHIRVLVEDDVFDAAFQAMSDAGLEPTVHSAVTVNLPDASGTLKKAMDGLARKGYLVDSVLVVPGDAGTGRVNVSFGISQLVISDWSDGRSEELGADIAANL
jgi:hypothetical protein